MTGFWKTYHLHTNEIIRISDFTPSLALCHMPTNFFSAMILVSEGPVLLAYMQHYLPEIVIQP